MDPQQRLLLETVLGGVRARRHRPAALRGSPTGVFVGADDLRLRHRTDRGPPRGVEGYLVTGNARQRPLRPDLVRARAGGPGGDRRHRLLVVAGGAAPGGAGAAVAASATLALAGGVTVMATPDAFVEFTRQRGLAAGRPVQVVRGRRRRHRLGRGRRHAAAGAALRRAAGNGHQVLAVVRGSAVNQDGASNGLTAPNGPSQQRVIRQALANAGLAAGRRGRRRGARHRHHAGRPDRGAGAARPPTARTAPTTGRCGWAR